MFFFRIPFDGDEKKINQQPVKDTWIVWNMLRSDDLNTIEDVRDRVRKYWSENPDGFRDYYLTYEYTNWCLRVLEEHGYVKSYVRYWDAGAAFKKEIMSKGTIS